MKTIPSRIGLVSGYAVVVLLPCILILLVAQLPQVVVVGTFLAYAFALLPAYYLDHWLLDRISLFGDFRAIGRRGGSHALAASIAKCHSRRVALPAVAAGHPGLRSRLRYLRCSSRLEDDSQFRVVFWMKSTVLSERRGRRQLV